MLVDSLPTKSLLVEAIQGNLSDCPRPIGLDFVRLQWDELYKRLGRYSSVAGRDVLLKFSKPPSPGLCDGDLLWIEEGYALAVEIIPCEVLILRASAPMHIAKLCYDIGNTHSPLFVTPTFDFLLPYQGGLLKILQRWGLDPSRGVEKLHPQHRLRPSIPLVEEPKLSISNTMQVVLKKKSC